MIHQRRKILVRLLVYILGIAVLALGVVLNIKTNYGVSPVNSVPYCISVLYDIELGNATIMCYLVYLCIEIILMNWNHSFQYKVLLQLPVGILFGKFTTLFNQIVNIQTENHIVRIILLIAAVFFTALGVVLTVKMKVVPIPPDGVANEIGLRLKKDLGSGKIVFDVVSVAATVGISLILGGRIVGVGVGTLVCALLIGRTIKGISTLLT